VTGWADHAGPIHLRGKLVIDPEHCTHDRLSLGYYDHLDMENDPIPQSRTGPPCSLLVMSEAEASALLLRIDRPARRSRRIVRLFSMSKWYNIWQIAAFVLSLLRCGRPRSGSPRQGDLRRIGARQERSRSNRSTPFRNQLVDRWVVRFHERGGRRYRNGFRQ